MKIGIFLVKAAASIVNLAVLALCLLLLSYGCYAIWDSGQIQKGADQARYEVYKPTEDDTLSFHELQDINPEVFGWLTVYGTGVDYPLVQGEDNEKYVNTDATGEYSLTGSLFLDCRNNRDFTDFNSIVYGHHMAEDKMFGDISDFDDKAYFEEHPYGSLYYRGRTHGIKFFAFLKTDAYDEIYTPGLAEPGQRRRYLDKIRDQAQNYRDIQVTKEDHLLLLSTCASVLTNGRYILAGKITEQVPENPFIEEKGGHAEKGIRGQDFMTGILGLPLWQKIVLISIVLCILGGILYKIREYCKRR